MSRFFRLPWTPENEGRAGFVTGAARVLLSAEPVVDHVPLPDAWRELGEVIPEKLWVTLNSAEDEFDVIRYERKRSISAYPVARWQYNITTRIDAQTMACFLEAAQADSLRVPPFQMKIRFEIPGELDPLYHEDPPHTWREAWDYIKRVFRWAWLAASHDEPDPPRATIYIFNNVRLAEGLDSESRLRLTRDEQLREPSVLLHWRTVPT